MGVGLERISAGTIFAVACAAGRDCTVGGAGTSASPKPAWRTVPRGEEGCASPVATPFPKPVLATTPRTPLAPPVPLPYPGPAGKSNEPSWAIFAGLPLLLALAGT